MNHLRGAPGAPISEALAATFAEQFARLFACPQLDSADQIFATDCAGQPVPASSRALDNFKAYALHFYEAAPDCNQIINQSLIAQDRLVLRVVYVGTQTGPLFGLPPTGQTVMMSGIGIFRFNDAGRAVENWALINVAGKLAQIGAFPISTDSFAQERF